MNRREKGFSYRDSRIEVEDRGIAEASGDGASKAAQTTPRNHNSTRIMVRALGKTELGEGSQGVYNVYVSIHTRIYMCDDISCGHSIVEERFRAQRVVYTAVLPRFPCPPAL